MNPRTIELLTNLRKVAAYGLGEQQLLNILRAGGDSELSLPELLGALREQADHRRVISFDSPLSGKRWRITGIGLSTLDEANL